MRESLEAGADLVCFSGDKLLGGPQAGIVVGRAELVERLRRHPLQRAVRADKLTLAALEGTLALYLDPERAAREVPVLRMAAETAEAVRARAERLAEAVGGEVEETVARIGGGALPLAELPSFACAVEEELAGAPAARRAAGDRRRPRRTPAPRLPHADRRRGGRGRPAVCPPVASAARCTQPPPRDEPSGRSARVGDASVSNLTLGTAGHIDHGKTWLVRALTGKDTDRLPEEKERGISIDLGYAPLDLPGGRRLSVIDVPGHERFVRNMVAGATGIDLFLLVIDATEGARPQTHEHLAILRLLGIENGVVAVTKADAADPDTLELVLAEARELVPGAAVVPVSAKTGEGLDELRAALAAAAAGREHAAAPRRDPPLRRPRLHPARDRHRRHRHALVGVGRRGRRAAGRACRRSTCACGASRCTTSRSSAPTPASASRSLCPGIERTTLRRGDALVEPGRVSRSATASTSQLEELEPIADHARLHVHHGTAEDPGAARQDRRAASRSCASLSPSSPRVATASCSANTTTLGGGRVLDPAPPRAVGPRLGSTCSRRTIPPRSCGRSCSEPGAPIGARCAARLLSPAQLDAGLAARRARRRAGTSRRSGSTRRGARRGRGSRCAPRLRRSTRGSPREISSPERRGPTRSCRCSSSRSADGKAYLPGTAAALGETARRRGGARSRSSRKPGFEPVRSTTGELARFLEAEGRLVRVGDGLAVGVGRLRGGEAGAASRSASGPGKITLARFRDLARHLAPAGAAPARALRRGRPHAPRRRRARPEALDRSAN